jgi:hypothetical protein
MHFIQGHSHEHNVQHTENPFWVKNASRWAAPVFNDEDQSMEQIDGRWVIAVNRVALGLVQEIALISPK